MNKTPTTLIIMDGFGLRRETAGNAIAAANIDGTVREGDQVTVDADKVAV